MHSENEIVYLYLDDIIPNRFQPREIFDEKALKELAISIKEHGVIQPIIVRSIGQKYEIIAGERRYKASALAGLTKIPAIVRNLDDKESSKVALLENLQRKNLNPIEEARTYQKILELDQMTQESLAKTMGKSQSAVANKIRLLSLSDEVQEALLKEQISERHARTLLNIKDSAEQKEILKKVIDNKMTVRELEKELKGEEPENVPSNSIDELLSGKKSSESRLNEEPLDINNMSLPTALDDLIKGNSQDIKKPTGEITTSPIDFVNEKPLNPTVDLGIQEDDLGAIKIIPPDGEESSTSENNGLPKFINYGEIDQDEINHDKNDFGPINITNPDGKIDLEELKSNATDINERFNINQPEEGKRNDSLDSLLNLKPALDRGDQEEQDGGSRFFSVPDEKPKQSTKPLQEASLQDLFKTPDIIPTENKTQQKEEAKNTNDLLDYSAMNKATPTLSISDEEDSSEEEKELDAILAGTSETTSNSSSIEKAVDALQKTIKELQSNGCKIEFDEMDMKNSYQMVIKIEKD